MNFELLKQLKNDIDNHYYSESTKQLDVLFQELIVKYPNIDPILITKLGEINRYKLEGTNLYEQIENLKNEVKQFFKKKKKPDEIFKQNLRWILDYILVYMKSDKLYVGMVSQQLDPRMLNTMISKMKQVHNGTMTKEESDKKMGAILFNKYGSDIVKKLEKK
jgi:hypothetical protein